MSLESYLRQHLRFSAKKDGPNLQVHCPRPELHKNGDKNPSCSVDVDDGLIHCFGCGLSGNVYQVAKELGWPPPPETSKFEAWSPKAKSKSTPDRIVPEKVVEEMHDALTAEARQYLRSQRCLTDEVIDTYKLGVKDGRLSIPIRSVSGSYRDVRRWLRPEKRNGRSQKLLHWEKGFGAPRLFPVDQLTQERLVLVEGELDALATISNGIAAITATAGVQTWNDDLSRKLAGKRITILTDNDEAGRKGAEKRAALLVRRACTVLIAQWPDNRPEGWDITDELKEFGRESLLGILRSARPAAGPMLLCMEDVEPEQVGWIWNPYIPKGKLTLVEGDPGVGKSWVVLAIASALSSGGRLPGREPLEAANILLMTAEDGLADTVRPRLDKLGADPSRIFAVEGPVALDGEGLRLIESYIAAKNPEVVVIDPLVAYMGAKIDLHKANDIRSLTAPLAHLAERYGCAIIGVRHLTKGTSSKAIYRGVGSIDLTASARSVLLAGCDPDDKTTRALVHLKSNIAQMGEAVGYRIDKGEFFWLGSSNLSAERILGSESGDASALGEAKSFLAEILERGPVLSREIRREAREAAISDRTLDRAKCELGVKSKREGIPGRQGRAKYYWHLPGRGLDRQDPPTQTSGEEKPEDSECSTHNPFQDSELRRTRGRDKDGEEKGSVGDQNDEQWETDELI